MLMLPVGRAARICCHPAARHTLAGPLPEVVVARQDDVAAPGVGRVPLQRVQQVELRGAVAVPVVACGGRAQVAGARVGVKRRVERGVAKGNVLCT